MHSALLTFDPSVETGVDSQISVQVNLSALSTPNKRLDYINPTTPEDDPWLGDIDFSTSKTKLAVWSSVLHIEISNNSMTPDQEVRYQGQLDQLGLTSMASDERLEAPSSKITSMVNRNHSSNLLASNGLNSKLLKASNSGLLKVGKLEGVFLNSGQELNMQVTLRPAASSNNGSGPLYGGGLGISYIGEDESGLNDNFVPVKSDSLRAVFDAESNSPSYLYSKFSGNYPLALGQSSMLKLSIGGYNDNKRHEGHLYLADAGSKVKSLPVYINAHLIREPSQVTVDPTGAQYPSTFVIQIQNMGSEDYAKVVVTGLPAGIEPIDNASGNPMCSTGVRSGAYCELTFDASSLDAGSYNLMINGLTASQVRLGHLGANDPDGADSQAFQLEVTGGF